MAVFTFLSHPWWNKHQFSQKQQLLRVKMGEASSASWPPLLPNHYTSSRSVACFSLPTPCLQPASNIPSCTPSVVLRMLFFSQREGAEHLGICFSVLLNFVLVAYTYTVITLNWENNIVKVRLSVKHINKDQVSSRRTVGSQVTIGHLKLGQNNISLKLM